jgi:hypothetical protein
MRVPVGSLEEIDNLALVPDMVASSKNVNSHLEEVFSQRRREAETRGCVLPISEHEINGMLFYERWKTIFDYGSSWSAENVTNKKNAHLSLPRTRC